MEEVAELWGLVMDFGSLGITPQLMQTAAKSRSS